MGSVPPTAFVVSLKDADYLSTNIVSTSYFSPLKPRSLSDISDPKVQETLVVKDLLSALLGFEGDYVRYSERYDAQRVRDRIRGPDFKTAKHLDVSLKSITKKLATYGKWYSGLDNFTQIYDHPKSGTVNQRLCFEIRQHLKKYQNLVLEFENHLRVSTLPAIEMDNVIMQRCANAMAHLYEIANTIHAQTEERTESPSFNSFIELVRQDLEAEGPIASSTDTNKFTVCKGGVVLQIVTERINAYRGDSFAFQLLTKLFDDISTDYVKLLQEWLTEGQIRDPFSEFLVKKNDLPTNIFYSNMEKYWSELFVIKLDGVPHQLASKAIQQKILLTGKFLNIFRQCTGIVHFKDLPEFAKVAADPIVSLFSPDLHLKIIHCYKLANKFFLRLLLEGYQFQGLIGNLHETFLLNRSFQIDNFLSSAFHDLSRDKQSVPTARVSRLYDQIFLKDASNTNSPDISTVLKNCKKFNVDSNNFYELAEEVIAIESFDADKELKDTESVSNAIKRIVSQSLSRRQMSSAESERTRSSHDADAIDRYTAANINIDLDLPFPINLIIGDNFVFEYQLLFKLQMILKYANMTTDRTWKEISFSTVWKYKGFHPSVSTNIARCRVLITFTKAIINALQEYLNFQIVEANYETLEEVLSRYAEKATKEVEFQDSSNGDQSFIKSYSNKTDVFDEKINAMNSKKGGSSHIHTDESFDDVQELKNHIGSYLSNMLRDAMVTDERLLSSLHNLLNVIIHISDYLSRLKKSLVLMDERQFAAFRRDMPERFADLEVTPELVGSRAASFQQIVDAYTETFYQSVGDMLELLRSTDASENPQLSALAAQLEACVPRGSKLSPQVQ